MSGFFWERVRRHHQVGHYTRLGRRAYQWLAEYHRARDEAEAAPYRALAQRFTRYAGMLIYLREIYVEAPFASVPSYLRT